LIVLLISEIEKGTEVLGGFQNNITPLPPVATVGTPPWNVLLPPETHASISTISGLDLYLDLINKHSHPPNVRFYMLSLLRHVRQVTSGLVMGSLHGIYFTTSFWLCVVSEGKRWVEYFYEKGGEDCRRSAWGIDTDPFFVSSLPFKGDDTGDLGEEGVIAPLTHVETRQEFSPSLTDQNAPRRHRLPTKAFDTQTLGMTVSPIPRRTYPLFMCHIK
jgi:hypothetical protein